MFTAFVALAEKGVPFELVAIDLDAGHQRRPEYRDASLTARVPAIRHGDFWLTESPAIVEYVDEVFDGPPLLPRDSRGRARVRQVLSWVRSDLSALREERPTTTMFHERARAPLSDRAKEARDKLFRVAQTLVLQDGGRILETWSIADADLAFVLQRLILNGDEVPARLKAYAEREWQRPSVARFLSLPRAKR